MAEVCLRFPPGEVDDIEIQTCLEALAIINRNQNEV